MSRNAPLTLTDDDFDSVVSPREAIESRATAYGLKKSSGIRTPAENRAAGGSPTSNHLTGHADDWTGAPDAMKAFTKEIAQNYGGSVRELYHDPVGGWKHGKNIGAIGRHSDHVHVAFDDAEAAAKPAQTFTFTDDDFEDATPANKTTALASEVQGAKTSTSSTNALNKVARSVTNARPARPVLNSAVRKVVTQAPQSLRSSAITPAKTALRAGGDNRLTTAVSATDALPPQRPLPKVEQDFAEARNRGDRIAMAQIGERAKAQGYEVGVGDGGWTYIKPPQQDIAGDKQRLSNYIAAYPEIQKAKALQRKGAPVFHGLETARKARVQEQYLNDLRSTPDDHTLEVAKDIVIREGRYLTPDEQKALRIPGGVWQHILNLATSAQVSVGELMQGIARDAPLYTAGLPVPKALRQWLGSKGKQVKSEGETYQKIYSDEGGVAQLERGIGAMVPDFAAGNPLAIGALSAAKARGRGESLSGALAEGAKTTAVVGLGGKLAESVPGMTSLPKIVQPFARYGGRVTANTVAPLAIDIATGTPITKEGVTQALAFGAIFGLMPHPVKEKAEKGNGKGEYSRPEAEIAGGLKARVESGQKLTWEDLSPDEQLFLERAAGDPLRRMPTAKQHEALKTFGYDRNSRRAMTPEQAEAVINERSNKDAANPVQPVAGETVASPRKKVSELSVEEMQKELLTSSVVDLLNKRAYEEAPKRAIQVNSDVDGLKWVNDNLGHKSGDVLLQAKAQILKEAGIESYHISGDEFSHQFDTIEEAQAAMEAINTRLRHAIIKVELPNGEIKQFTGAGFSYGAGRDSNAAETALREHKAKRETTGERSARGERPGGFTEIVAEGQQNNKRDVATAEEITYPGQIQPRDAEAKNQPIESTFQPVQDVYEVRRRKLLNLSKAQPEVSSYITEMYEANKDRLTGFHNNHDRFNTMDRAIKHVDETGEEGHYVAADIANLGGLNAALTETGANKVYRAFTEFVSEELEKVGASVSKFRHGGDEFSAIIFGASDEAINRAMTNAKARAVAYAKENGLSEIANPKGHSPGTDIHFGVAPIDPKLSPEDNFKEAEKNLELAKGERSEHRKSFETLETRPPSGGSPVPGTEETGRSRQTEGSGTERGTSPETSSEIESNQEVIPHSQPVDAGKKIEDTPEPPTYAQDVFQSNTKRSDAPTNSNGTIADVTQPSQSQPGGERSKFVVATTRATEPLSVVDGRAPKTTPAVNSSQEPEKPTVTRRGANALDELKVRNSNEEEISLRQHLDQVAKTPAGRKIGNPNVAFMAKSGDRSIIHGSFSGKTTQQILKAIPKGWKRVPARGNGWKLLDENGIERVRFMRPDKSAYPQWGRMKNGYWRRQDAAGNYLDETGKIVDRSDPDIKFKTHIPYSGAK